MTVTALPEKLFFRIGEVADIVGVKPHVLRYWEEEFAFLKPMKTRGAHRVYKRRDVETAMIIRKLLHDEGYTVPGARKKLRELNRDGSAEPAPQKQSAIREANLRTDLLAIRGELQALLDQLEPPTHAPTSAAPRQTPSQHTIPAQRSPHPVHTAR